MLLIERIAATARSPNRLLTGDNAADRKRQADALRQKIVTARRYALDENASRTAARLGTDHPNVLLGLLGVGVPPFERIWIEWHNRAHLDETGSPIDSTAPELVGAFIERLEGGRFRLAICGMTDDGMVAEAPLAYVWSPHETLDRRIDPDADLLDRIADAAVQGAFRPDPNDTLWRFAMGSAYSELTADWIRRQAGLDDQQHSDLELYTMQRVAEIGGHVRTVLNPSLRPWLRRQPARDLDPYLRRDLFESAGAWRYMVAVLGLINQGDYVSREPSIRPERRRMLGHRLVPYLDHWTITMKVPRQIAEREIRHWAAAQSVPALTPRQEVAGHWRHRRGSGDPDCSHVYAATSATQHHCVLCGRFGWHVREYMRGDANMGFVTNDRLVVAAADGQRPTHSPIRRPRYEDPEFDLPDHDPAP